MPTDIEDQIASYFTWVEARTGFSLHATSTLDARAPTVDDASVIELATASRRPARWTASRVAAISAAAAAVVVGVIVISNRPVDQPQLPAITAPQPAAITAPTTDPVPQTSVSVPSTTTSLAANVNLAAITGSYVQNARMTSATTAWVVTDQGLARTSDGGATWETQDFPPLSNSSGSAKSFILDDDHAYVLGVDLAGQVVMGVAQGGPIAIGVVDIDPGFANGIPAGVVFVDATTGYISVIDPRSNTGTLTGRAALLRTVDGGATFELVASDAPVPVAFSDPQNGWATGAGLFVTTDGAATWSRVKPPLWDSVGPDPNGPSYQIVMTSADLTVVKVVAPTGTQAQVAYVATTDNGATWRDVAPPNTAESDNSGSRSMLTAVSATTWFGIQQGDGQDAVLWATTDGGASYRSTTLPFPATSITMSTATTGLVTTAADIRITADGGATWTKVADIIAP